MPLLPFDRSDPPPDPPAGCTDNLKWELAYQVFRDHRPDNDGVCIACVPDKFIPCHGRDLALRGFLTSLGLEDLSLPAKNY